MISLVQRLRLQAEDLHLLAPASETVKCLSLAADTLEKQANALKLAREALESCDVGDYSTGHVITPSFDAVAVYGAITAINEVLGE